MPETCENWLGLVNSRVYNARQTREIYLVLPFSVDFKTPRELWNPPSKTVYSKYRSISNNLKIGSFTTMNCTHIILDSPSICTLNNRGVITMMK